VTAAIVKRRPIASRISGERPTRSSAWRRAHVESPSPTARGYRVMFTVQFATAMSDSDIHRSTACSG
jgi:hypothetical protein